MVALEAAWMNVKGCDAGVGVGVGVGESEE